MRRIETRLAGCRREALRGPRGWKRRELVLSVLVAGSVALSGAGAPAHAWSKYVHELICEMAVQQLGDAHRSEVFALSSGQGIGTFARSCEWADDVRRTTHLETYEYHYLNHPRAEDEIDFARDCAAYDCVSQAVVRYALYLENRSVDEDGRAEALRFLGHFVGDLHQPLHAGWVEDRGGNLLFVALASGERPDKKLHAIWDGTIPERLGLLAIGQDEPARVAAMLQIAAGLVGEITDPERASWRTPAVRGWMRESHRHVRDCTYRVNCDPAQRFLENGDFLSPIYWSRSEAIAKRRIQMASVRLALLIELALDGALEPAELEVD